MIKINFELLRKMVLQQSEVKNSPIHGLAHWRKVEKTGLVISEHTNADETIIRLFALFHDSMRQNEDHDPGHGLRGAELVKQFHKKYIPISNGRFELLYKACSKHADGLRSADPTIGTCWDADRLDLGRIGIIPSTEFMSTAAGRKLISSGGAFLSL